MGTTLTGTTPQDTYDSLIKVTDNGPLSGTAKYLSDGLGNDSVLALSTSAVGIGTSSPTEKLHVNSGTGNVQALFQSTDPIALITFDDSDTTLSTLGLGCAGDNIVFYQDTEKMRIDSSGKVGIGTSAPAEKLDVIGGALAAGNGTIRTGITYSTIGLLGTFTTHDLGLITNGTEKVRIDASGNVGIGTNNPAAKLDVSGGNIHSFYTYSGDGSNYNLRVGNDLDASKFGYFSQLGGSTFVANNNYYASAGQFKPTATAASFIGLEGGNVAFFCNTGLTAGTNYAPTERVRITSTGVLDLAQGQIKFPATQVPSADANTLDDYEEGTWTMGVAFGGASVGVTYSANLGTYTKVGRQVTVNGLFVMTSKGSSVGNAVVTGLPFTNANGLQFYSSPSLRMESVTFTNQFQGFVAVNQTNIELEEITASGTTTKLTNADFSDTTAIIVTATYFV